MAFAAGSVDILLGMTDHQRALTAVNVVGVSFVTVVAISLTVIFGLRGLVATYLLLYAVTNNLKIGVL